MRVNDAGHKFDPKDKELLLSPERRALDSNRLFSLIPIQPYHDVADIGCGPGYFSIPLAKYVWGGKVYALDVQREMLDATEAALKEVNLTNGEVLLSKEKKLPLKKDAVDGALLAFVLQEADDRRALLKEAMRCLRKAGWLAILEWHKKETEIGPPVEQRIDDGEMESLVGEAGFRISTRRDLDSDRYLLLARK